MTTAVSFDYSLGSEFLIDRVCRLPVPAENVGTIPVTRSKGFDSAQAVTTFSRCTKLTRSSEVSGGQALAKASTWY